MLTIEQFRNLPVYKTIQNAHSLDDGEIQEALLKLENNLEALEESFISRENKSVIRCFNWKDFGEYCGRDVKVEHEYWWKVWEKTS